MKNNFKKIIKSAKKVSLSGLEREEIRSDLLAFIDAEPIMASVSISPIPKRVSIFSLMRNIYATSALLPAMLLLVLLSGGTLTLASAGALPGDAMYPMKKLSEKIDLFFAFTPAAEARVNAIQAVRRLEEAEALSSRGRLDSTTKLSLESSFTQASGAALRRIDELQSENKTVGLRVLSEFRGNLSAHRDILQSIVASADGSLSHSLPQEVQSVIAMLGAPTTSVISVGVETLDSANEARSGARETLSGVEKYVAVNLTGEAKVKALSALIAAQAAFENGSQALEAKEYNDAVILFVQATDNALQAKALAQSYNSLQKLISKIPEKPKVTSAIVATTSLTSTATVTNTSSTSTLASTTNATSTNTSATSTQATTTTSSGSDQATISTNASSNSNTGGNGSSGGVQVNVGGSGNTSVNVGPVNIGL